MPLSDAYRIASGSPRSAASSSCVRLIALRMPRRRRVGRTAIQLTAAVGTSCPPGIVSSSEYSRPVPTIRSPSNAASVRSSSTLVQSSSKRSGSKRSPNAMSGVIVKSVNSSRVTGRSTNSGSTRPVSLTALRAGLDFSGALGRRSTGSCSTSGPPQPREPGPQAPFDRRAGAFHAAATTVDRIAGRAHAGDVRQAREPEPDCQREQADAEVLVDGRDGDRDERAGHPRDLEAGLEPGEGAAAHRVGRVALEQAVERDAAGGGAGGDEQGADRRHREGRRTGGEQATHRGQDERAGEDDLLACDLAQLRRDEVAEESADAADDDHEPEDPWRLVVVAQPEREEERQEPDGAAQQPHGAAGEDDARGVELLPLAGRVRTGVLRLHPRDVP